MNFVVTMRILGLDDEKQTEPFLLPEGTEWPYFQAMIESLVDVSDPMFTHNGLDIRYWDEEDLVILSSQDELNEACRLASESGLLQLFIRGKEDGRNFAQYQPNLPSLPPLPLLKYPYPEDEETTCQGFTQTQGTLTFVPYKSTLSTEEEQLHQPQPSVDEMLSVEEAMQDFRPAAEMLHGGENLDGFAYGMPAAEHTIIPGAASGANVIAIEMPECASDLPRNRHAANGHGTETAEPAEMAETGEVSPKSGRDAETGFWMVQKKMVDVEQAAAGIAAEADVPPAIPPRHPLNPVYTSDSENPVYTSDSERVTQEAEAVSQDLRRKLVLAEQGVLTREDLQIFIQELKDLLNGSLVKNVGRYTALKVLGGLAKMKEQKSVEPAAAKREEKKSVWPFIVHDNFFCDNCDKAIVGPRYKCGNCDDYDLCEKCEDIFPPVHDNTHSFVKLRYPAPKAGIRHGQYVHLLRTTFYITKKEKASKVYKKERELEELRRIEQGLKSKEQKLREKLVRNATRMQRRLEQASPKEQPPQVSEQAVERMQDRLKRTKQWLTRVGEKTVVEEKFQFGETSIRRPNLAEILSAVFVCDNTVPDGMLVRGGQRLSKQWVMRNSGTITWPLNTVLREEYSTMQATEGEVFVGQVAPGELVTITVELVAPQQTGEYESRWRLYTGKVVFGHMVYCKVRVDTMIKPAACSVQEGERLVADLQSQCRHMDQKSTATGMGDGCCQPQHLDRKKLFRWLDIEEKDDKTGVGQGGLFSPNKEDEDGGLHVEEAEVDTHGSASAVDAAAACIMMTKCSPAMPSTPNNTPFGCSRAVTPPPEEDIILAPASHTDALFRQELVDSLKKSATISALEEVEAESRQYSSVSWTCLQPSCPFADLPQAQDKTAESNDQVVPNNDQVVPNNDQVLPNNDQVVPNNDQVLPNNDQVLPNNDQVLPNNDQVVPVQLQEEAALFFSPLQNAEEEDVPEEDGDRDVNNVPLSPSSTTSSVVVMSPHDMDHDEVEEENAQDYTADKGAAFPHCHSLPLLPVRLHEGGDEGDGYEMIPGNDLDSFSSSVSTDTEDDFCIVMPDCFDLTKPLEESYDPHELAKVLVSVVTPTLADNDTDACQQETEPPRLQQLEEERHKLEQSVFTPSTTVCSLQNDCSQQLPPNTLEGQLPPNTLEGQLPPNTLEGQPWKNADVWKWFPNHPLLPVRSPAAGLNEEAESLKDESCAALPVSAAGGDDMLAKVPTLPAEEAAGDTMLDAESAEQPAAEIQLVHEPAAQESREEPAAQDEPAEEETAAAASPVYPVDAAADQSQQSGASHEAAGEIYPLDKIMETVTRATGSGLQFLFQTTKDVFKNLQAPESHKPRESNYTPPKSTWTPTRTQYVPPRSDYQPPKFNFTMPTPRTVAVSQPPSSGLGAEYDQAMQRLLEMGYFNKPRNAELLQTHKGDIQAVLEVLLVESDNDWAAKRH